MQDSIVLSHTPLLDVHYCVASFINIWDEEHAASSLVGSGPPGQDTDTYKNSVDTLNRERLLET